MRGSQGSGLNFNLLIVSLRLEAPPDIIGSSHPSV